MQAVPLSAGRHYQRSPQWSQQRSPQRCLRSRALTMALLTQAALLSLCAPATAASINWTGGSLISRIVPKRESRR